MTRHAETRASEALSGDHPELMAAFLASANDELVALIAKLINNDDSELSDAIYDHLVEYVDNEL